MFSEHPIILSLYNFGRNLCLLTDVGYFICTHSIVSFVAYLFDLLCNKWSYIYVYLPKNIEVNIELLIGVLYSFGLMVPVDCMCTSVVAGDHMVSISFILYFVSYH
uniref:Uncharacterized protein n=1 Tax=Anthurium amnicola TaxID=1678845 RepID=A0A1D1YQ98_9ARAE